MKTSAVGALLVAITASAATADRYGLSEREQEAQLAKCLDDQDCASQLKKQLRDKAAREAKSEAEFQKLPIEEKLFRWLSVPALLYGLYWWVGRK